MKILQIIPAERGDACCGASVRCFLLAENAAGQSMIIPCLGLEIAALQDIIADALSLYRDAGFYASENRLLEWANERAAPSLLEEVFDQAQHALSPALYERVRKALGR